MSHLKCPASYPSSRALPELLPCPQCNTLIEIWTDEIKGECSKCKFFLKKLEISNTSLTLINAQNKENEKLKKLTEYAKKLGASDANVILTKDIIIDSKLADICKKPKCENYGLSKSCPPNVAGPLVFKKQLEKYSKAIVFKIDVLSQILFSSERREFFQLLHEIAANIEQYAVKMEFKNSKGYAGGSCKKIFCYDYNDCPEILEKGKCRNPQSARPSMSGFGINVLKLMEQADWKMNKGTNTDSSKTKMTNICGLVLI